MSLNRIFFWGPKYFRGKLPILQNSAEDLGPKMPSLEEVVRNNKRNEEIITSLKQEIQAIQKELVARKKVQLRRENAALLKQVETTKTQLVALEIRNGKKQIPIPGGSRGLCTIATTQQVNVEEASAASGDNKNVKTPKPPKEKPKKEKPSGSATTTTAAELPVDVGRLDMRVGKILDVSRHPDADSLYVEKIDCGEEQPRTVVSGLVKFVPLEEMQNRMVVLLCNLKPAKMRGVTSEAMVMCASTPDKVEVLSPPNGAVPGDLVHCEGFTRQPDAQLNPKKKIFETCAPDLKTNNDLVACYKDGALHVPGKGNIVAQSLRNVNVK